MRRLSTLFGTAALVGSLLIACTDEQATAPEETAFRKVENACVPGTALGDELTGILEGIDHVYEDRNAIRGARQIVDNIARKVCAEPPNHGAAGSMAEGFYDHVMNELEHLTVPLADVVDLVELVFGFALGTDPPTLPEGAFDDETGTVAVVLPGTDDIVRTPNMEAALVVDPASFGPGDPVTVVLARIADDQDPIPGFTNFAERYEVFVSRQPDANGNGVLVAVCVPDDQDLPPELALGHYLFRQVELLVPVDPGAVLDCTQSATGYPFLGPVLGVVGMASRALQPVVDRFLGASPLNATLLAGTGLGGRTKSFSPFAPVDPTIEVGQTVQLTIGTDDVEWSSNDETVATVDDGGLVTGVGVGTATITALVGGMAYTIDITVEASSLSLPFTCATEPSGGDYHYRGFYIPSYPGTSLARVTLHLAAVGPVGSYDMRLTAFDGTFDGTILGTAETSEDLDTSPSWTPTAFTFGPIEAPVPITVTPGSTIAFELEYLSGPEGENGDLVFYRVPSNGDSTCPVVQTNYTIPPLDTKRRDGIWITVLGSLLF